LFDYVNSLDVFTGNFFSVASFGFPIVFKFGLKGIRLEPDFHFAFASREMSFTFWVKYCTALTGDARVNQKKDRPARMPGGV